MLNSWLVILKEKIYAKKCERNEDMNYIQTKLEYILLGILVLSMVIGGGYFVPASVVSLVLLMLVFLLLVLKKKVVKISADLNLIAFIVLVLGYLLSTLWAVDKGMALIGFIKYLPIIFFLFLLYEIEGKKEKIIGMLPTIGVIMTLVSAILMHVPPLSIYFSVAERLSGFFQYPNVYAIFMLVCIIIESYKIKETLYSSDKKVQDNSDKENLKSILCKIKDIVYLIVSIFGIYLSGSRTVFVLAVAYGIFFLIKNVNNEKKKVYIGGAVAVIVVLAVIAVIAGGSGLSHIISTNLSTFWGRLLYYYDAIPYILKHPFGVGYYGYAFTQYSFQSGVYTLVNVHNELLQFMLDIGWIPAFLFYGCIVKTIVSKTASIRDKAVLIVLLIHSLFDFDFRFISIMFVVLLFLENKNVKEYKISYFTKIVSVVVAMASVVVAVKIGLSETYIITKDYDKAIAAYSGNTLAKIKGLYVETDLGRALETANEIVESNKYVPDAYNILAQAELANGNVEGFIDYKQKAISLAPYNIVTYEEYLDGMEYCMMEYSKLNDNKSVEICAEKIVEVSDMLDDVKNSTSRLGWMIKDKPELELGYDQKQIILGAEKYLKQAR